MRNPSQPPLGFARAQPILRANCAGQGALFPRGDRNTTHPNCVIDSAANSWRHRPYFSKGETMRDRFRYAAALMLLLGLTLPCAAQNAPAPQTRDPKACSDQLSRSGRTAPQPADPGNQTLSEKLSQTD